MHENDQNAREDDIRAIRLNKLEDDIFERWQAGKTLRQIATELNLPIAEVQRILSKIQKSIIRKGS